MNHAFNRQQLENLEARFGQRVAYRLKTDSSALPHEVKERLKTARAQALAKRKSVSRTEIAPAQNVHVNADGSVSMSGGPKSSGLRSFVLEWVLPIVAIATLLVGFSEWQQSRELEQFADVEAAMLSDELPTQAYTDPGFAQFLKVEAELEAQEGAK